MLRALALFLQGVNNGLARHRLLRIEFSAATLGAISTLFDYESGRGRTKLSETLAPSVTVQQLIPRFEQSPSDFLYTHNGICLHNITINAISYGSPVVLKLQDIRRFLFFVLVIRGECRIASGENGFVAKANEMFVINAGQPIHAELSNGFQEIVIGIDVDALTPAILRMIDRPISIPIRFDCAPLPFEGDGSPLGRFIRLLCAEMDAERTSFEFKAIGELYEQTLLSLMLTSLPHNYSEWLQHGVPAAIPYYVRRAERFVRDNLRLALTLDDIVQASGTGMRSLHQAFREFRRTTPMLYLKECRLQLARARLQDKGFQNRSIAELAHEVGFEYPNKFSRAYRLRFNELPSTTRLCTRPD